MRISRLRRIALLGLATGSFALGAGDASAGIQAREARQRHRIHRGAHDGSLTAREAGRLTREQARTERMEHRFRANDGHLGPRERVRLQHRLDHSARHIYRGRHNDRAR